MPLNLLERILSMNESLITLGIFVLFALGTLYAISKVIAIAMRAIFSKSASHSRSHT